MKKIRSTPLSGLGRRPELGPKTSLLMIAGILGIGFGFVGWQNRQEALGQVALGAGGSMVASALVLFLDSIL